MSDQLPNSCPEQQLNETVRREWKRLRKLVAVRLDSRLTSRLDPSDVLQDAFAEAAARIEEFPKSELPSFFLWVRLIVCQKISQLHRHHLGAQARNAAREIPWVVPSAEASSVYMASQLACSMISPSSHFAKEELHLKVLNAIEKMEPNDREIIALRHFEQLSNQEVGEILGLDKSAASKRYFRAIQRLKSLVDQP